MASGPLETEGVSRYILPMSETEHTDNQGLSDETLRRSLLDEMLFEAAFDGWTPQCLKRAARAVGLADAQIEAGEIERLFPGGIGDVLDLWSQVEDEAMIAAWDALEEKPRKIRDKITWLVRTRIEGLGFNREVARRAAATLALPPYALRAQRLAWRSADQMWRAIGDRSLDANFYTKRATLTGVYLSTLARWFADEANEGDEVPYAETWAFLDKRIDNVMQIEKVKAQANKVLPNFEKLTGLAAKLRYPGAAR